MNHIVTALAVMLLVPLYSAPTFAERPSAARLMSDQTLAYIRIADSREYGEKFSQTSLGKALEDPQMQPFVNGIWQTLKDTFSEAETKAGVSLEALLDIPQGEFAASVVAMQEGSPAILLLCSLGEDLRTAEKLLKVLETAAESDGATIERSTYKETKITLIRGKNGPLAYALHDHTLLASSRMEAVEDLIEHWDGEREDSLASDSRFNTIIASSRGTNDEPAQLTWYVNPIELLRAATRQNSGGGYIMAFMPVLGLDGVKSIGGSQILATEDFDSISHLHIMLERPRTGVLELSREFGSSWRFKKNLITEIAAVLAFSAIQNNDKAGVILFSDRIEKFIPPKKGKKHILHIIRELIGFTPGQRATDLSEAFRYLTNAIKKRCTTFVISDFLDEQFEHALRIANQKHDVVALRVYDAREAEMPDIGFVKFKDAESGALEWINTSSAKTREAYSQWWQQNEQQLKTTFSKCGVDHVAIATDQDYVKALISLFKKRS